MLPLAGRLRAKSRHGDGEEAAYGRLGGQAPGGGEGVQAVTGEFAGCDVGPDDPGLGARGEQVAHQVLEHGRPSMVEVTGLTKRYGGTVAVDDLSFTVPPGQVTGFLGPNGAAQATMADFLAAGPGGSVKVSSSRASALTPSRSGGRAEDEGGRYGRARPGHPAVTAAARSRWGRPALIWPAVGSTADGTGAKQFPRR